MKKISLFVIMIFIFIFSACEKKNETPPAVQNLPPGVHAVKIADKIDTKDYTYLDVFENGNRYWIAVPKINVEKGETLYFSKSLEMKNFHSPTINRTFDSILFVEDISKTPSTQPVSPAPNQVNKPVKEKVSVKPLENGKTIAQIFSEAKNLAGKKVRVRGQVTKYNPGIMDRNWIHIQDGTNFNSEFDLLATSKDPVQLGQTIIVEGTVAINQDFGAGYAYRVMLENAKVLPDK